MPFPTPGGPKRTRRQQLRRSRKRGLQPAEFPLNHPVFSILFRALIFSPVVRLGSAYIILLRCCSLGERGSSGVNTKCETKGYRGREVRVLDLSVRARAPWVGKV